MKRYLPFVIVALVLIATVAIGMVVYRAHLPPPVPTVGDPGAEPPHTHGEARAAAVLEEFGDFQCPPCGKLAPDVAGLEKKYGKKLRVVFRNFPLAMHKNAMPAACAAEAAGLQNKFWEMHRLLYETQPVWIDAADPLPSFEGYATKIGLDLSRFKSDMKSEQVKARITADQRRAKSLGVESTPILFVNNERVQAGPGVADRLSKAIDGALTKK